MRKTGNPPADLSASLWSEPVAVTDIPEGGLHLEIRAPEAVRAAVAGLAAVREVSQLAAAFDLTRLGEAVHVAGQVTAEVGQTCVVTLEPITTAVDELIDLSFAPPRPGEAKSGPEGAEPPERLVDGTVDLGAIATEFMILGIDPYPRKAGAQFAPPKVEDDTPHPFAGLAALKNRPGGDQT